ncbi:MAG TPA: general secretion pathway protein GspK [Verrucomicrobiota bacterium]|nr:general secretion pathway protein GspK [Verrucomicrobiota bacterium]HNU50955.1 general secretion pathway protein GspK [Verrucomicrobiota bacterium]
MKTRGASGRPKGFAIIIVMIVIMVLAMLAGAFALSMKVETRLAGNANNEAELEWMARSGVELARYVLGQSMGQPHTSLNQIWAGGPGSGNETNGPLMEIQLTDVPLGAGRLSIRIEDLDRRFNINAPMPDPEKKQILNRALTLMGMDAGDAPTIEDSILDWLDPDDASHLSGTESDFYLMHSPPYVAKNGPIDDLAELLLVRGVTPESYWGPRAALHVSGQADGLEAEAPRYPVGLADLFTPLSGGRINVNTASAHVLQLLPGVDENVAQNILRARAGADGVDGTEDDTPFLNVTALNPAMVPGIIPELAGRYTALCSVSSSTFAVLVEVRIGMTRRVYRAVVRRNNPRDVAVLQFGWR